ncbi:MAG TPA: D-aminoacyl-tRNA deacylase [Bacillota bacterium]|nr:D-aminoacyl-tRNA deacylase [Bacillota bacterium]
MRLIIQRVSEARVTVSGAQIGAIGAGLLIFAGVGQDDGQADAEVLAEKAVNLRIFADADGKMNLSAKDLDLPVLVVSQFTLYADCSQGRRPFFGAAAEPGMGERLFEYFCDAVSRKGLLVQKGQFRSHMEVQLVNDGPVTIILDSKSFLK